MMITMKAIETVFNGYRFRSRLEARWAVFFVNLGIEFRYEHEGYNLNGTWYLPDFYVPDQDYFIEIKPTLPTREEREKAAKLCIAAQKQAFILSGDPWENVTIHAFQPTNPGMSGQEERKVREILARHPSQVFWLSTSECIVVSSERDSVPWGIHFDRKMAWGYGYWTECEKCKKIGIFTPFYGYCSCKAGWIADSPRLIAAYTAARQARFEHGENG